MGPNLQICTDDYIRHTGHESGGKEEAGSGYAAVRGIVGVSVHDLGIEIVGVKMGPTLSGPCLGLFPLQVAACLVDQMDL